MLFLTETVAVLLVICMVLSSAPASRTIFAFTAVFTSAYTTVVSSVPAAAASIDTGTFVFEAPVMVIPATLAPVSTIKRAFKASTQNELPVAFQSISGC